MIALLLVPAFFTQVKYPIVKSLTLDGLTVRYSVVKDVPRYLGWGCDEPTKKPLERFGSVKVTYGKETFPLATSAYSDLFWMHEVRIRKAKEYVVVWMNGGDADSGYECEWFFKKGQLLKRRVSSSEFPENFWEETKYVNIRPNN